jgi:hypothetical protein
MIASLKVYPELDRQSVQERFLQLLPGIRNVARYAFRRLPRADRDDIVAEVIANAYLAFRQLVQRGKADLAYPSVLGWFAVRQVREGRRVGSRLNAEDVTVCPAAEGIHCRTAPAARRPRPVGRPGRRGQAVHAGRDRGLPTRRACLDASAQPSAAGRCAAAGWRRNHQGCRAALWSDPSQDQPVPAGIAKRLGRISGRARRCGSVI